MSDFSIITCISDPKVYNECLLKSINSTRGEHDIEIIPVVNNDNHYSASNALNWGIDVAESDVLIFSHQDVRLLDNWFDILQNLLDKMPENWGMLGSAGIALKYGRSDVGDWGGAMKDDTVAIGTVWDSDESLDSDPYWNGDKKLAPAHAADECLLILNKKTGLRFDSMFNGFHFYGVDMCLQARAAGYTVFCAHLPIIHYGKYSASLVGNNKYWVFLRYLHYKWKYRFPELYGTHMHWCDDELTSYIPVGLESDGLSIQLKSMGLEKVELATDSNQGIA